MRYIVVTLVVVAALVVLLTRDTAVPQMNRLRMREHRKRKPASGKHIIFERGRAQAAKQLGRQTSGAEPAEPVKLGAIEGWVTNDGFEPIAGATVRIELLGPPPVTKTDEKGYFRFEGLEPRTYLLHISHHAYCPAGREVAASDDNRRPTSIYIVLDPLHVVTGLVLNGRGEPIEKATVGINVWLSRLERMLSGTDENGRFTLEKLPPVIDSLTVCASGYLIKELGGMVLRGGVADIGAIILEEGYVLEGTVVGRSGPVKDANLSAVAVIPAGKNWREMKPVCHPAITDKQGYFAVEGLETAKAEVTVEARGYVPLTLRYVSLPAKEPLTIKLERARTVTVKLVSRGMPPGQFEVMWCRTDNPGLRPKYNRRAFSGHKWIFELSLKPGVYRVFVRADGFRDSDKVEVDLREEDAQIRIHMERRN
jgi:hypothetical protein